MSNVLITSVAVMAIVIASILLFAVKKKPASETSVEIEIPKEVEEVQEQEEIDNQLDSEMAIVDEEDVEITPDDSSGIMSKVMTVDEKLQVEKPSQEIDISKSYTAKVTTSEGVIEIKLDVVNKPVTTNNFVYLANLGFYNDIDFHRIVNDFMIQGGDPLGSGQGGPAYKFEDELSQPNENKAGTIAMANAGPNTNGSQFFINLVNNNFLDTRHTVFGEVISGLEIVEKIAKTEVEHGPSGELSTPVTPVEIESVEIIVE